MKTFTDNKGRKWEIELNVTQVRRVRDALGINLYKSMENDFKIYTDIIGDGLMLVDVLCVLCRDQAKELNVSDEDFGRAMRGDVIKEAVNAFTEELIDFFPDARMRATLTRFMEKAAQIQVEIESQVERAVEAIDVSTLTTSSSSGNTPAPSESTPAPSLSGS